MVKLNADMKEAFSKMKVFPVATASKDGTPNVVPLAMVSLHDDETIWITDNFMNKSMTNIRTNPKIAIYIVQVSR
jgi:predicted pyridoxine 5'-phosphate oxidase superfamily flavin-nucleotide-binding protein